MLLDDTEDVVEVFCEHHEDVLLKHRDGKFTGQQVKTRELNQPLWKAGEAQVKMTCARFIQLDMRFRGCFRAYRFLTCHPIYVANNSQSLGYVLSQIESALNIDDLPSSVRSWLRRVAREAAASETAAFDALKKATASAELPKLQNSLMRLIHTLLGCWSGAADCSHESVTRAAKALVDDCAGASALDHEQLLPAYVLAVHQPALEVRARIEGKRMTADRVQTILADGLNRTASLVGELAGMQQPGQGSSDLLLKKLDAGGFSAVSRNSAEDLRDKADYLGIVWTKKLGRAKGLERYDHIRSVALNEAARAFEATKNDGQRFGPAMREELRRRFQARRFRGEQLFDCSDDHLEGFAYSLTAQCKVLWSSDRPWETT